MVEHLPSVQGMISECQDLETDISVFILSTMPNQNPLSLFFPLLTQSALKMQNIAQMVMPAIENSNIQHPDSHALCLEKNFTF